jgi:cysteinyl-tRNA synthetase
MRTMDKLKIYNTLAREKQEFVPIEPGKVRMYVCGMTIYDYCHIGHARMMMAFDVAYRWLKATGYDVTYVRNITDIDDKIIKRAVENGETIGELTARFTQYMDEDTRALGILEPTHVPHATQYVPQMLSIISQLEQKGLAYRADGGDVNYAVRNFANYGQLSGKSIDELKAGMRERIGGDNTADKRDPLDFVLWKSAKPGEPAEAKWDSPWGVGRPGWHIECSAMSCALLGEHFDIHGGGADLQFPHHENELAQSEGAFGHKMVNYWMHNGFVRVDGEKMSKSLDNFFTIRDVLKEYDAEVIRFFILRAHYRSPLNYSDVHIDDAKNALTRLYTALAEVEAHHQPKIEVVPPSPHVAEAIKAKIDPEVLDALANGAEIKLVGEVREAIPPTVDWTEAHAVRFSAAMNDDFNTPLAVAELFDLATEVNKTKSVQTARQLKALAGVLGLLQRSSTEFLQAGGDSELSEGAIDAIIAERTEAKKAKDFTKADMLRRGLAEAGVVLEDKPGGATTWRRA